MRPRTVDLACALLLPLLSCAASQGTEPVTPVAVPFASGPAQTPEEAAEQLRRSGARLRLAVEDLTASFPGRYPKAELLERLAQWERRLAGAKPEALASPDAEPVLDRHCVRCHNRENPEGGLDLTGELTQFFSRSYEELIRKNQLAVVQEFIGPDPDAQKSNAVYRPPMSLGSHASRLIRVLREGHYEVKLAREEWVRLVTWVDANGPYYGSYFGRRNLIYRGHPDFRPAPTLEPPPWSNALGRAQ